MEIEIDSINWLISNKTRRTAKLIKSTKEIHEEFLRSRELKLNNNNVAGVNAINLSDFHDIDFIPKNIKFFFPNLYGLYICSCNLKKISREDLGSLTSLKELHIFSTFIEELHDDLFIDLQLLEIVSFACNKIKFIGKNVFKNLDKLRYVNLAENPSIDIRLVPSDFKIGEKYKNSIVVYRLIDLNLIIEKNFRSTPQIYEDIQNVLKIDDFKDFTIKIEENEFKVHKLLLAARSGTLAEMIKENPHADELMLEDIEIEILKNILDYIYEDKMPEKCFEELKKVFAAAGKLKIEKLKEEVGKNLMDFVKPDNSFEMFLIASKHDHKELKEKSFEELKKFLNAENLKNEMMENIEALTKLVNAKVAYDKMKKDFEENL